MFYRVHGGQLSGSRMKQARVHRMLRERHADALRRASGITDAQRRRRILDGLVAHLNSEFYNERNLGLARMYADFMEEQFPDMDPHTRATVRKLRRRTYLPRALSNLWDQLHAQGNG